MIKNISIQIRTIDIILIALTYVYEKINVSYRCFLERISFICYPYLFNFYNFYTFFYI